MSVRHIFLAANSICENLWKSLWLVKFSKKRSLTNMYVCYKSRILIFVKKKFPFPHYLFRFTFRFQFRPIRASRLSWKHPEVGQCTTANSNGSRVGSVSSRRVSEISSFRSRVCDSIMHAESATSSSHGYADVSIIAVHPVNYVRARWQYLGV